MGVPFLQGGSFSYLQIWAYALVHSKKLFDISVAIALVWSVYERVTSSIAKGGSWQPF